MSRSAIETVLGAIVLIVAGVFLTVAFSTAKIKAVDGYTVTADFSQSNGLVVGGDIRISGVKIGTIRDLKLNPESFLANVTMSISPDISLPDDTVAKIEAESLLGGNYLSLEPGGSEEFISKDGKGKIEYTQAAVNLGDMIGKLIFAMGGDNKNTDKKASAQASETTAELPEAKTDATDVQ